MNIPKMGNIATPYWGARGSAPVNTLPTMGNKLKSLREARHWTQDEAAAKFDMSRSGYIKLERGERKLADTNITKAARIYGVSQAEVIGDSEPQSREVPVVGRIGAGGDIDPDFEQVPPEGLYTITVPFPLPDEMMALEVVGESMLPRYDHGDVIVVWKDQRRPIEAFLGTEVAVLTTTGRRFLKTLQKAGRFYNLLSWNAKPIENVSLKWVGEIFIVVRAPQVQKAWAGR